MVSRLITRIKASGRIKTAVKTHLFGLLDRIVYSIEAHQGFMQGCNVAKCLISKYSYQGFSDS